MDIRIGKSSRVCAACERDFVHEETIHSLLRLTGPEFSREDYCISCWEGDKAGAAYSSWSPQYYDPAVAEAEPPEVFSPLRQLFYDAVEGDTRQSYSVAYLAAQLLRRQKVFRLIKESDEAESAMSVLLFADRIGDRLIEVRDPDLTHEELQLGRQTLVERLNELEHPAEAMAGIGDEDYAGCTKEAEQG